MKKPAPTIKENLIKVGNSATHSDGTQPTVAPATPQTGRPKVQEGYVRTSYTLPGYIIQVLKEEAAQNYAGNASYLVRKILETGLDKGMIEEAKRKEKIPA